MSADERAERDREDVRGVLERVICRVERLEDRRAACEASKVDPVATVKRVRVAEGPMDRFLKRAARG